MAEFERPSVEKENENVVCVGCSDSITTDEAEMTMDSIEESDKGVLFVTRYYICSGDCATDFMLSDWENLPHETND